MINAVHAGICTQQAKLQAEALHPGSLRAKCYFSGNRWPVPRIMGVGTATSREKKSSKRGHEGIEPSTSPTLKENHTTRPMAHAPRSTESLLHLPATPALWFPRASSTAFRAPLAERSAVNRQVLGSIPSGGVLFIFTPRRFLRRLLCAGDRESPQTPWRNGSASDSKSEGWGFDSLWRQRDCSFVLIDVILTVTEHLGPPSAQSSTPWRNGSASDSKSEGWGFESLWRQDPHTCLLPFATHTR